MKPLVKIINQVTSQQYSKAKHDVPINQPYPNLGDKGITRVWKDKDMGFKLISMHVYKRHI